MAATNVATLFLDRDCRISRFTPRLTEIFNIKVRDLGRPVGDITHSLKYDELESDARKILQGSDIFDREVRSTDGHVFVARLSPYRLIPSGEIDGAVVNFIDVTGRSLKT